MKTLLVRPLFVKIDTKDSLISDRNILTFSDGKIYNPFKNEYYQLILISLDPDEKIEVGDVFYSSKYNTIDTLASNGVIDKLTSYKVIATQDQLSPDLIYQLVCEYNNEGMQDFEIEMAVRSNAALGHNEYVYLEHIKNKSYLPIKIDANINQDSYQLGKEEEFENWEIETYIKLTNGFVTVVDTVIGKPFEDYINEKHSQDRCMGFIDGYNARKLEDNLLYTNDEIFILGDKYEEYCINCFGLPKSFSEWFNENKKK